MAPTRCSPSISFSLADSVHAIGAIENLTLTGIGAINGTGNALDNILIGNTGNNILTGLGGDDTLNGGAGADTAMPAGRHRRRRHRYVVDNAGDVVDETAAMARHGAVQRSASACRQRTPSARSRT